MLLFGLQRAEDVAGGADRTGDGETWQSSQTAAAKDRLRRGEDADKLVHVPSLPISAGTYYAAVWRPPRQRRHLWNVKSAAAVKSAKWSSLFPVLSPGFPVDNGLTLMAWSMPDLWLTCDHFVGKVSAIGQQPGQLGLPSLQSRWMSSDPCNYIDFGGWDHLTADHGCVWLVFRRSVCRCKLSEPPTGGTRCCSRYGRYAVTWTAPLQLRYAASCAMQVLYVFAFDCPQSATERFPSPRHEHRTVCQF